MNGFFYPWWFWGCTLGLFSFYAFIVFKDTREKKTEKKDEVEEFAVSDDEEESSTVVEELPGGDFRLSGEHDEDLEPDEAVEQDEDLCDEDYVDDTDVDYAGGGGDTADADEQPVSSGETSDDDVSEHGDTPYDEAINIQNTQMSPVRDERKWEQMFGSMDMFAELAAPLTHKTLCKRTPITTV